MTNNLDRFLMIRGSMSELARRSGVNISMLSNIRTGIRRPCKQTARKIADALDQPVEDIFPNFQELPGREVQQ